MSLLEILPEKELFTSVINNLTEINDVGSLLLTSKNVHNLVKLIQKFITVDNSYHLWKINNTIITGYQNNNVDKNIDQFVIDNNHNEFSKKISFDQGQHNYYIIDFYDLDYIITSLIIPTDITFLKLESGGNVIFDIKLPLIETLSQKTIDIIDYIRYLPYNNPHHHEYILKFYCLKSIQLTIKKKKWSKKNNNPIIYKFEQFQTLEHRIYTIEKEKSFTIKLDFYHVIKGLFIICKNEKNLLDNDILTNVTIHIDNIRDHSISADSIKCDSPKNNNVPLSVKKCYYIDFDHKINFSKVDNFYLSIQAKDNIEKITCAVIAINYNFLYYIDGMLMHIFHKHIS